MATHDVTRLLAAWADGDTAAVDPLMTLVYDELHRMATHHMAHERSRSLQAPALVHEAWVRLVDQSARWQNRAHFFAVAARMMRRILVDHARAKQSGRRGQGAWHVSLGPHGDVPVKRASSRPREG